MNRTRAKREHKSHVTAMWLKRWIRFLQFTAGCCSGAIAGSGEMARFLQYQVSMSSSPTCLCSYWMFVRSCYVRYPVLLIYSCLDHLRQ